MSVKSKKNLVAGVLVVLFFAMGLKNDVVVTHYTLQDISVKTPFKVAFVSDTHSCKYGENQSELIDKIIFEKPDFVLLGGDIVDDVLPREIGIETIKLIAKNYQTFYVTGNHEIWIDEENFTYEDLKEELSNFENLTVLDGNYSPINIGENKINILGIDDPFVFDYQSQLQKLQNLDIDGINLLIAHRPERTFDYQTTPANYVFSGHAHGGQWRIPLLLEDGLLAPNQGFFPKYTKGVHDFDSFKLIVSRGLSRESTRIPRFYNPPELVIVNFVPFE